jgi:tetratricopeptide (TPR) repeat protein
VAVFDRLRLPLSAPLSRASLIRVGELVGASEVIFGQLTLGSQLSVRADAVRLDDGRSLAPAEGADRLSEIFALFSRLGGQLARAIGKPPSASPPSRPAIGFPAFESYVKGLVAATPAAEQRFLETAMTLAPHDGRVLLALWRVYADQGAHEKALGAASAVPADAPEFRRARFGAALSLIELRRFDGAAKALSALAAERPSAAVWNALGIVALRRGSAGVGEASVASFARAVAAEPTTTDYHFNLGYARALGRDSSGAVTALREAVKRDAADGDAHLVLSTLLAATGAAGEAAREFELARVLGTSLEPAPATLPASVPPGLERVTSELEQPAVVALDAALDWPAAPDPRETAVFFLERGRRLALEQNDRAAVADVRRSIYLAPYEHESHLLLGRLYQRGGRLADAIDEFKVAIWCRETVAARIALGTVYLDSGDRDAARREAERALVLEPRSVDARALLRKIDGGTPRLTVLTSPASS